METCRSGFCNEPMFIHEGEWARSAYCPRCGYEEVEKYDAPIKLPKRNEFVYAKKPKRDKDRKSKAAY